MDIERVKYAVDYGVLDPLKVYFQGAWPRNRPRTRNQRRYRGARLSR